MRTVVVFMVAVLLLSVQSALHTLVPTTAPLPAFALYAPLFVGFSPRWSLTRTVVLAFLIGYIFDLVSGAPVGVHAVAMPLLALGATLLGTRLRVHGPFVRTVMTFVLTLAFGALVLGTSRLGGTPAAGGLRPTLLEAGITAALAAPLLALFDRIERRFDNSPVRMGRGHPSRHRLDTGIELRR